MLEFILHAIAFIGLIGIGWKIADHFIEFREKP